MNILVDLTIVNGYNSYRSLASYEKDKDRILVGKNFLKMSECSRYIICRHLILLQKNGHDMYKADKDAIIEANKIYSFKEWYESIIELTCYFYAIGQSKRANNLLYTT